MSNRLLHGIKSQINYPAKTCQKTESLQKFLSQQDFYTNKSQINYSAKKCQKHYDTTATKTIGAVVRHFTLMI